MTNKIAGEFKTFKQIDNKNDSSLAYIVTYIIPFLFSFSDLAEIIAFTLLFFVIGILYIKSDLIYVNPTLNLIFKYNIIKGVQEDGQKFIILTKKDINIHKQNKFNEIAPKILISKE